jgi:TolB-like protein
VLPFDDFSESGNQAHLARGIADTVLHMLAQVPDLKVAARTSSFAYQGTGADIATIAGELGVGAVLEGSVQRSGDRMRVIAQLIRASDQTHLWSRTFDSTADDVFAIQDEIATSVVAALRPSATASTGGDSIASERTDVAAYEHYLRGKEGYVQGTAESTELALRELQAATLIDPEFVPALIQLGFTYMQLNSVTPRTWAEIEPLAEAAFRRAYGLAPDDPEAIAALGSFIRNTGYDPLSALPYFERALELNPNDTRAMISLAQLNDQRAQYPDATELFRHAFELDPNNPNAASAYGNQLVGLGRYDEARSIARRLLVTRPDEPIGYQLLVDIEIARGRLDLAIPHAVDQMRVNPGSFREYHQLATLYAQLDDQTTALAWYERTPTEVQTPDYVPALLYWTADDMHRVEAQFERDVALYEGWDSGQRRYVNALFLNRKLEAGTAAAERYEDAYQTATDNRTTTIAGAMALRTGQTDLAQRLLALARDRNQQMHDAGFDLQSAHHNDAVLAIADGDADAAFAALTAYCGTGGHFIRGFRLHPVWDPLRDDPRFDAFMDEMAADLAAQRAELEAEGLMALPEELAP